MQGFAKVLLYLALFFGIFGMLGMLFLVVSKTNTRVVRPDRQLDELIENMAIPGRLSVMVARNKFVIYDKHRPLEENSDTASYPLGSLGELFIAHAVQHLIDTEQLDPDAPLDTYLPDIDPSLHQLTAAHLLTHTSGLSPDANLEQPGAPEPGLRSEWAEINYRLLDRLVRMVADRSPYRIIEDNQVPALASATRKSPDLPLEITGLQFTEDPDGIGLWRASARDLNRWELAMNTGILAKLKTHLRATRPAELADGKRGRFGFGWELSEYSGLRLEEFYARENHLGAGIFRFAEKTFAVVILTDQGPDQLDIRDLGRKIADIYLGREYRSATAGKSESE
ncbi:MAG: serine hydrolase domain-containing protein [Acidobacteriota bacterium]|nr:serine hydrolase domain-containing protein [Acidobacteriota bacterium]